MAETIHKLARLTRSKYNDIIAPDPYTLYFTSDTGELFMGTTKIGAGFVYIDGNNPRPESGQPGYFYIDRKLLDMYIWDESIYRWVYLGNAGSKNAVSLDKFYEVRQELLDQIKKLNDRIDELNNDHLYTEVRLEFTTDEFAKVPDTDYYAVTLTKPKRTDSDPILLVKNVYSHIDGADAYQAIYPDITETSDKVILQFTVPVEGFCILS